MNLSDLLRGKNIDPERVLVVRHRPHEPELNKAFPLLAADRDDLFYMYERVQTERVQKAMSGLVGVDYLASFIAFGSGKALFVRLTKIARAKPITYAQYWKMPPNIELRSLGMSGLKRGRRSVLCFNLEPVDFYRSWKGKLVIDWPPPDRSWSCRAHKNQFPVHAILEESAIAGTIPDWKEIDLTWAQLQVLPKSWQAALAQWRAIYYIFDESSKKGYVGTAYGRDNLLQRWLNYAKSGHGHNRLLRRADPHHFRFTILERMPPDMDADQVIRLEATWKDRLHSRAPLGLNDN